MHGSCLPPTEMLSARPRVSTVRCRFNMDEGGFTATRMTISSPFEIPPSTPPEWLVRVPTLPVARDTVNSSLCSLPFIPAAANPDLEAFYRGDRHERPGQGRIEFIEDGVTEARRATIHDHLHDAARGIPLSAERLDLFFHRPGHRGIGAAHGIAFDRGQANRPGPDARGFECVRVHLDPLFGKQFFGDRPCGDPPGGLPSRRAASTAVILDAVFREIRVPGVPRPENITDCPIGSRVLIGIPDEKTDRGPERAAVENSAEDLHAVRLPPGGGEAALSGPPPVEFGLDVRRRYLHVGTDTVDEDPDGFPVALPECGDAK